MIIKASKKIKISSVASKPIKIGYKKPLTISIKKLKAPSFKGMKFRAMKANLKVGKISYATGIRSRFGRLLK